MRWRVRSIRELREPAPGLALPALVEWISGLFGLRSLEFAAEGVAGVSQPPVAAMSRATDDDPGKARSSRGAKPANSAKPEPESEDFEQQSEQDGVPEDMATLVLDNPALGHGAVLDPTQTHRPSYAMDESSDAAVMLRVAAGDEAGFNYLAGKYHRAMINFLYRMVHNQAVA